MSHVWVEFTQKWSQIWVGCKIPAFYSSPPKPLLKSTDRQIHFFTPSFFLLATFFLLHLFSFFSSSFFFSFSLLASVCAVQHLHSKWHRHDQTTFASKIENLNLVRFEREQLLCVNCFTCWSTNVPRRAETLKF